MTTPQPNDERLLYLLKSRGPQATAAVARHLGITAVGARKHLQNLEARGLVRYEDRRQAVGRPKRSWSLTEQGHGRFPDAHADLTLELLRAVRGLYGAAGLERLISQRERDTLAAYRAAMQGADGLAERVRRLAALRRREGYMAEWRRTADGGFLLAENHCPICAAATECQGFCRSELEIFRAVLGKAATVERTDHILAGARRCAYRITPR